MSAGTPSANTNPLGQIKSVYNDYVKKPASLLSGIYNASGPAHALESGQLGPEQIIAPFQSVIPKSVGKLSNTLASPIKTASAAFDGIKSLFGKGAEGAEEAGGGFLSKVGGFAKDISGKVGGVAKAAGPVLGLAAPTIEVIKDFATNAPESQKSVDEGKLAEAGLTTGLSKAGLPGIMASLGLNVGEWGTGLLDGWCPGLNAPTSVGEMFGEIKYGIEKEGVGKFTADVVHGAENDQRVNSSNPIVATAGWVDRGIGYSMDGIGSLAHGIGDLITGGDKKKTDSAVNSTSAQLVAIANAQLLAAQSGAAKKPTP